MTTRGRTAFLALAATIAIAASAGPAVTKLTSNGQVVSSRLTLVTVKVTN